MSKKTRDEREPDLDEAPLDVTAETDDEPVEHSEEDELTRLRRERDEYLSNWQRAQADYQNQRRRTVADIDAAVRRAQGVILDEVLLVLDYLDMALAQDCQTEEARNLLVGVRLTRDQLVGVLDRQQVKPIPVDVPFDPELHQAVASVETLDAEPGSIVEVVRSGWTHKDHVLRYAQVKVAAHPEDDA